MGSKNSKYLYPTIEYFKYEHLPEKLKNVSKSFFDLADELLIKLPDCSEKYVGFRKLLEAKDCMVRAAMYKNPENDI